MTDTSAMAGLQRVTRSRRSAAWGAVVGVVVVAVLGSLPYLVYANVTGVLVNLFILSRWQPCGTCWRAMRD